MQDSRLYRLSSVMAKPRKAPSSRNAHTHSEATVSMVKKHCQATSK